MVLTNVVVEYHVILPAGFKRKLITGGDVASERLDLVAFMDGAFVAAMLCQVSIRIWVATQASIAAEVTIDLLSIVKKRPVKDDIVVVN